MNRFLLGLLFALFANAVTPETLMKESVVCYGEEETISRYITANQDKKEHMESHECGITQSDTEVKILGKKTINRLNKSYSIVEIEMRYFSYGKEFIDKVWTFEKYITK